jgi:hypothetical protein
MGMGRVSGTSTSGPRGPLSGARIAMAVIVEGKEGIGTLAAAVSRHPEVGKAQWRDNGPTVS